MGKFHPSEIPGTPWSRREDELALERIRIVRLDESGDFKSESVDRATLIHRRASIVAAEAQLSLGEAYRSPHTLEAAMVAAKILVGQQIDAELGNFAGTDR